MSERNHPFVGLFVGLLLYGGLFMIALAGTAFILGSANFADWGIGGRAGAIIGGAALAYLGALPLELGDARRKMTEALIAHWERNQ